MKFHHFTLILPILCWSIPANAQFPAGAGAQASANVPEQWELTLDVIKSKAQSLLVANNGLQGEYRQLLVEEQQLRQKADQQQLKNQQMAAFLKQRHGRHDQQIRIEELTRDIKAKKPLARRLDDQLAQLQKKKGDLDRKIQQLKYTIANYELHPPAPPAPKEAVSNNSVSDAQVSLWQGKLQEQNRLEAQLAQKLALLKNPPQAQNADAAAIEAQNKVLESRLEALRLEKLRHLKQASDLLAAQSNAAKYDEVKKHKEALEADINTYASRLNDLRQSSLMDISWPAKRKQLVHDMAKTDAHNNQMRSQIKGLGEDIDILREQVAKLERRLDFARGQAAK